VCEYSVKARSKDVIRRGGKLTFAGLQICSSCRKFYRSIQTSLILHDTKKDERRARRYAGLGPYDKLRRITSQSPDRDEKSDCFVYTRNDQRRARRYYHRQKIGGKVLNHVPHEGSRQATFARLQICSSCRELLLFYSVVKELKMHF
jgi:hypothetical protein